jgi:Protein of unknown function (DUF2442)
LPTTAGNLVEQWRRLHVDELVANWERAQEPVARSSVEPLSSLTTVEAARVTEVECLGRRMLRITFDDGLVRELDFADALPGVLAIIDDDDVFPTVTVDRVSRTVTWPVGVDFDPDVLHGDHASASGAGPIVLREYHREPAR